MRHLWLTLFLAPAFGLMAVFLWWPALAALGYSLFDWNGFTRGEFVGLKHFVRLLQEPHLSPFISALGHNAFTFAAVMLVQNGLALLLAYALFRRPRGFGFFRGTVFLPVMLSLVVTGFLWQLFLHPLFGPITQLALNTFGMESFAPLGDADWALPTAVLMSIWRHVGFPTLVFLAGMNALSPEMLEAARIDGASDGDLLFKMLVPNLAPAFTIVTLLSFIGAFEWFDLPFILGGATGSPAGALDTLALMFFRLSFGDSATPATDVGLGAAVSVLLFAGVLTGALLLSRWLRQGEDEART